MIRGSIEIQKGDYAGGGKASALIKGILNNLMVSPEIIKKAMIAIFEAEMNIIIHSYGGKIIYKIDEEKLEIEAVDKGPGISNVVLAIKEGYSTAPPLARELGFGAGMGLPNIKKNTDFFSITSSEKGTILKFFIKLTPSENSVEIPVSITFDSKKCKKCLACIKECPTRAIRLRENDIVVLDHRCINCNRCIEICPTGVFDLSLSQNGFNEDSFFEEFKTLILPTPIAGKLYLEGKWWALNRYMKNKFGIDVVSLLPWELALQKAIDEYSKDSETKNFPVIFPACPSVIQWIQTEYPSLIVNVAPFLFPFLASIEGYAGQGKVLYVPLCPSQIVSIESLYEKSGVVKLLHPKFFYKLIKDLTPEINAESKCIKRLEKYANEYLNITGIIPVRKFLDNLERERLRTDLKIVGLYNCYGGCFGFPYTDVEPYYLSWHINNDFSGLIEDGDAKHIFRVSNLRIRKGIRLGSNMKESLQKLSMIEKVYKILPGRDCAVCGAPRCADFAEEVAVYAFKVNRCPYVGNEVDEGDK